MCAALPQHERRTLLERTFANIAPPMHLTPATRDAQLAAEWLSRFEGAGLDGVMAKPDQRHVRTRQARDDQGEACADGRLRRRRLPMAQGRQGTS